MCRSAAHNEARESSTGLHTGNVDHSCGYCHHPADFLADSAQLPEAFNDMESAIATTQAELTRLKEKLRHLVESAEAMEHEPDGAP